VKGTLIAIGVCHGLRQAVVQQDTIRETRQRIMGGQVAQLAISGFQTVRADR